MTWWLWILVGLTLLVVEVIVSGDFYLLFAGLAAIAVGAMVRFGVGGPDWAQWLLFAAFAIVSLLFFRGPLIRKLRSSTRRTHEVDSLVGEIATLMDDLPVSGTGKAEMRGTAWTVRNGGNTPIAKGERARVRRVEGLTLWIEADTTEGGTSS